jgi:ubiquinone/menaquinone biosynthesis C-methylase UbiE
VKNTPEKKPPGAGRSSFSLIDPERVFGQLRLKKGSTFLDMASGRGEYAIAASQVIGDEGLVYAIDLWEEGIVTLMEQASAGGIKNLKPILGDVCKRIPIENDSVDVCLMATVLHELVLTKSADVALKEAVRVLSSQGCLAIIEFNKVERPPGPPIHIRLSPEDVESIVTPHGFRKKQVIDVGPYNYLIMFDLCANTQPLGF